MTKMTKNENNDSFMRDKNIMRAVDGKRNSHFAWPKHLKIDGNQFKVLLIRENKQGACLKQFHNST